MFKAIINDIAGLTPKQLAAISQEYDKEDVPAIFMRLKAEFASLYEKIKAANSKGTADDLMHAIEPEFDKYGERYWKEFDVKAFAVSIQALDHICRDPE